MNDAAGFQGVPPTTLADVVGRGQVMDAGIRPLWGPGARVVGVAFTVRCPPGDNLMMHAAIYRAEPGMVIVAEAGDTEYALAGGNVCAVAQRRGVTGFVVDGVIRDVAEVRDSGFPVFARGVMPVPGVKNAVAPLNGPVSCGGVVVHPGDIVVADEEGAVVVPHARREQVLRDALAKQAAEEQESLDEWERAHHAKVERLLAERGFTG